MSRAIGGVIGGVIGVLDTDRHCDYISADRLFNGFSNGGADDLAGQTKGSHVGDFDLNQLALERVDVACKEDQSIGAGAAHDLGWVLGVGGFDEDFLDPIGVALGALSSLG